MYARRVVSSQSQLVWFSSSWFSFSLLSFSLLVDGVVVVFGFFVVVVLVGGGVVVILGFFFVFFVFPASYEAGMPGMVFLTSVLVVKTELRAGHDDISAS